MPTELLSMQLLHNIRDVLTHARQHLQYAVNQTMVQAYWQVGRLIVEEEQQGQQRAGYGKQQLEQLSKALVLLLLFESSLAQPSFVLSQTLNAHILSATSIATVNSADTLMRLYL